MYSRQVVVVGVPYALCPMPYALWPLAYGCWVRHALFFHVSIYLYIYLCMHACMHACMYAACRVQAVPRAATSSWCWRRGAGYLARRWAWREVGFARSCSTLPPAETETETETETVAERDRSSSTLQRWCRDRSSSVSLTGRLVRFRERERQVV